MSKMDGYKRQLERDFFYQKASELSTDYRSISSNPKFQQEADNFVKDSLFKDLLGNQIEVGDRVAFALTIDRSSNMAVGIVTNLDAEKGIKVKNEVRSYQSSDMKDKVTSIGFPNRVVVLQKKVK